MRSTTDPAPGGESRGAPLEVFNLLNDMRSLAGLLRDAARGGSWLDAYLVAAGMNQIAEDHLRPSVFPLDEAAAYLAKERVPFGTGTARVVSGLAVGVRALHGLRPATRRVSRWQGELAALVAELAAAVAAGAAPPVAEGGLREACDEVAGTLGRLPRVLQRALVRLPACFQAFDQRPADCAVLVRRCRERWPDRAVPVIVVGVRTSGSYLAPLCRAYLELEGYQQVNVLTARPGRGHTRAGRRLLAAAVKQGARGILIDDPPVSGSSLAAMASELEACGMAADAIVLLLQVFGSARALPGALARHDAVVLPWPEWSVGRELEPTAVATKVAGFLGPGADVLGCEPVAHKQSRGRAHCRAAFRLRVRDAENGDERNELVAVEGVGLGYFGTPAVVAARSLERFSPGVLGLREGLLYRRWVPAEQSVGSPEPHAEERVAAQIAAYAEERRRRMPVDEDISLRLRGERPAWEVASMVVSRSFGRGWPVARLLMVDRAIRRLLRVSEPSVVDGSTGLENWFYRELPAGPLVKVRPVERSFWNLGLTCFDSVFDAAGASARAVRPSFAAQLRKAHADVASTPASPERWLLYELAHLWGRQRAHPDEEPELRRAGSRALQRYFSEVYLSELAVPAHGPLCALDVDGVLETEHLGFPSITPSAASALRALLLHGYRPLLVTGRSLPEVVERCYAYRLAGGVAEYGSAAYDAPAEAVHELVPAEAAAALERLRAVLEGWEGVSLDPDYRLGVRAFRQSRGGARSRLRSEETSAALGVAGRGVRAIPGERQTDFVAAAVDKGNGLQALVTALGTGGNSPPGAREPKRPVALAVGDTVSDLPLSQLAELAAAPAHAGDALCKGGFTLMSRPYQAGLAQAVAALIGHAPGACEVCRGPELSADARLLLNVLGAQERGGRGMALEALKLAGRLWAPRPRRRVR